MCVGCDERDDVEFHLLFSGIEFHKETTFWPLSACCSVNQTITIMLLLICSYYIGVYIMITS